MPLTIKAALLKEEGINKPGEKERKIALAVAP
jgi:hypothetical protein